MDFFEDKKKTKKQKSALDKRGLLPEATQRYFRRQTDVLVSKTEI